MNTTYSLKDLSSIAKEVIASAEHRMLLFYGDMGVGKTTLIKEICTQLGVLDTISSPNFSLVNEYQTNKNETVYHFDFYRIENQEEAYDIGIEDYFDSNHWCLVEWPENVENLVPLEFVEIQLSRLDNNQRNIQINQHI
jgi:tRNA threonylcarbamoyladenosine biosynthesis protein TsaE